MYVYSFLNDLFYTNDMQDNVSEEQNTFIIGIKIGEHQYHRNYGMMARIN